MRHIKSMAAIFVAAVVGLVVATTLARAQELRLTASGASFPFPIYSAWFKDFSKQHKGVTIDYQEKDSPAGIRDFIDRKVDFAASDEYMTDEQIAKVEGGVVMLPMTAGGIVLAYNLPGNPTGLKLARDVYADIFLGKITMWNDPRIAATNPDLKLPQMPITVVPRSDGSGTTVVFTKHLAAISDEFAKAVGTADTVHWPTSDKFLAARKNDGVTATIERTPGAIGYIEYGYAKLTKTNSALLQNKAGNFVAAGQKSVEAALAGAKLDRGLHEEVVDPEGAEAYPIASFSWMLFYKKQDDKKAELLRKMVDFGITDGQKIADSMGYIPLPANVVEKIKAASAQIQ